jgi:Putative beta-barrel porin-2, OmpL-like. bbp2
MPFRFCKQLVARMRNTCTLRWPQVEGTRDGSAVEQNPPPGLARMSGPAKWAGAFAVCVCATFCRAQSAPAGASPSMNPTPEATQQQRIEKLEEEVRELKVMVRELQHSPAAEPPEAASKAPVESEVRVAQQNLVQPEDRKALDFMRDTTINLALDTYYAYNFNHPVGRVNLLRAYDVLSNEISLNQASVILEHAPDLNAGRRWGARLDLQFGQATDTLQGNPLNEPRPEIYRNVFQAYGTYVIPLGKGVNVDFGKWGSSLGIEGNYTKDQMNYSRSFWFGFLPFYHMGLRASVPVNDKFSVNYWVVNGTNQVEATNGFKDQLFGFTSVPSKNVSWTMNYYLGQEHPDRATSTNCGPIPVQPGLCFTAIRPAPDGRTHIFDSYISWKARPKLTFALEGDYVIERLWRNAALGESSAPSHADGGAAYVQYQVTPKVALATRAEYMSDRGGLFSGVSQALKENTVTLDYRLADGLLMRYEWRRDFSNQPSFLSDVQGVLSKQQNTATLGLVWWWGRKEASW